MVLSTSNSYLEAYLTLIKCILISQHSLSELKIPPGLHETHLKYFWTRGYERTIFKSTVNYTFSRTVLHLYGETDH